MGKSSSESCWEGPAAGPELSALRDLENGTNLGWRRQHAAKAAQRAVSASLGATGVNAASRLGSAAWLGAGGAATQPSIVCPFVLSTCRHGCERRKIHHDLSVLLLR